MSGSEIIDAMMFDIAEEIQIIQGGHLFKEIRYVFSSSFSLPSFNSRDLSTC